LGERHGPSLGELVGVADQTVLAPAAVVAVNTAQVGGADHGLIDNDQVSG
jgi:hypothetical protein